jgi:hypothetical protein
MSKMSEERTGSQRQLSFGSACLASATRLCVDQTSVLPCASGDCHVRAGYATRTRGHIGRPVSSGLHCWRAGASRASCPYVACASTSLHLAFGERVPGGVKLLARTAG